MHLEWFKTCLIIAQTKSLSKAGEILNLSQPAVSKQVKKIEDVFGVELFHRSHKGIEVTMAGERILKSFSSITKEINDLRDELGAYQTIKSLTIITLQSVASYYLPEKLLTLRKRGIETTIKITETSEDALKILQSGEGDIAIIDDETIKPPLWKKKLFSEPFYTIFPLDHPLTNKHDIVLDNLKNEDFIVYKEGCSIRKSLQDAFTELGLDIKISYEVPFGESILGMVAVGAGITVLPEMIAKHIGHFPLKAMPIYNLKKQRTLSIISRSERIGKTIYPLL